MRSGSMAEREEKRQHGGRSASGRVLKVLSLRRLQHGGRSVRPASGSMAEAEREAWRNPKPGRPAGGLTASRTHAEGRTSRAEGRTSHAEGRKRHDSYSLGIKDIWKPGKTRGQGSHEAREAGQHVKQAST
jgi:hypothetical protein